MTVILNLKYSVPEKLHLSLSTLISIQNLLRIERLWAQILSLIHQKRISFLHSDRKKRWSDYLNFLIPQSQWMKNYWNKICQFIRLIMESKKTPLTGFFTKISVFCAFAPFFSHKEKWRYLLCCLWKESNAFWKKNQRLLDNLSYIEFADEPEMIEIIKSLFIVDDSAEELCRLNQIFLRFLQNPKGWSEFIKLASDYKLKKLSWFGVSALSAVTDENVIDLERFWFNTLPSKFKKVSLHGWTDVYRFLTFLSIVLQKVSDQVILSKILNFLYLLS